MFVALATVVGWWVGISLYGTCWETPTGGYSSCWEYRVGRFADPYVPGATTGAEALVVSLPVLWWRPRNGR